MFYPFASHPQHASEKKRINTSEESRGHLSSHKSERQPQGHLNMTLNMHLIYVISVDGICVTDPVPFVPMREEREELKLTRGGEGRGTIHRH
ncbi:hypothetical protein TNIN_118971 [Trichonephila inaurata madagascariensis]|uniref:Uncharacterized protein n=1 Tax=Trichonephila inaurata madagascariensis TaxID=2747483 RepID=A0A8X7CT76_9ARAC|nr:hypothetical protein TNIN_118971 [Trichonephila inaurata madagascariensis]